MRKKYSELLKDPRWQKIRLQIMNRDGFMCQECGDNESMLNVHHMAYDYNKAPWEYNSSELKTLCTNCHEAIHNELEEVRNIVASFNGETLHYAVEILWKMKSLNPNDCSELLDHATHLAKINTNG